MQHTHGSFSYSDALLQLKSTRPAKPARGKLWTGLLLVSFGAAAGGGAAYAGMDARIDRIEARNEAATDKIRSTFKRLRHDAEGSKAEAATWRERYDEARASPPPAPACTAEKARIEALKTCVEGYSIALNGLRATVDEETGNQYKIRCNPDDPERPLYYLKP
jgi:hypothetical protein